MPTIGDGHTGVTTIASLDFLSGQILRDSTGTPYLSAKAYYWADSGYSVALDTYSDAGLGTPNTNPVVANGTTGAFGLIFLAAKRYWRQVYTSAGVHLPQFDAGPIDGTPGFVTSATAPSPTYPFLVWYDTTTGHKKTRAHDDNSWIDNGAIDSLINAASVSDVITGTSTSLSVTPDALAGLWEAGTCTIVSNNISLPSSGGGVFTCATSTTTLNTISSSTEGREVEIIFSNAQTITHGSGINTIGALTYTVPAGARVRFRRNSSTWTIIWQCFPSSPGRLGRIATQYFAASGTYTRTKGCAYAFVRTVGPGGGGASSATVSGSNGSYGGGGGAGAYCEEWVTPGATETVTIGTGGAAQSTAATAGNNGSGASSFGSYHSAGAGSGGATMNNATTNIIAAGGAGGTASNAGLNINGQPGGAGWRSGGGGTASGYGGGGGSNPLGIGAPTNPCTSNTAGSSGVGYGAGGSGGAVFQTAASANGGAGTDGICIVEEYAMV